MNTDIINKLKDSSNGQSHKDNQHTRNPLFVVQQLGFVAVVKDDWYSEGDNYEGKYVYEYFTDDGAISRECAIEMITKAIEDGDEDLAEIADETRDWLSEDTDLIDIWENFTSYGARGSGLCKYVYADKAWYITKERAEEHLRWAKKQDEYRIVVKDISNSDITDILKELGFKYYD